MKTILQSSTLLALVSIAASLALDLAGSALPTDFVFNTAFGLFVVSFTLLTAVSDYARSTRPRLIGALAAAKAAHPLAA